MDIHSLAKHPWLGLSPESSRKAIEDLRELMKYFDARENTSREKFDRIYRTYIERIDIPGLFGTSGIRGISDTDISKPCIDEFVDFNRITPKLDYFFGRAVGQMIKENNAAHPVWLVMDPRPSSLSISLRVIQGLLDEGIDVLFGGVATTPIYTLNRTGTTIVITASHNPVKFNGYKLFMHGRPAIKRVEKCVESAIRAFADLDSDLMYVPPVPAPGHANVNILELERRHFSSLFNLRETAGLRFSESFKPEAIFLPLDLAYGSAGCQVDARNRITRISPAPAVFLSLDIPVIGYGCLRRSDKINSRIGAAYAYGETSETLRPGELAKFARGLPGYADAAPRTFFLPESFATGDELLSALLTDAPETSAFYRIPIGFPEFKSKVIIVNPDDPDADPELVTALETEMMRRHPLPGLIVDGDADRILVTAPELSMQEPPYLTGDAMLRLFCELDTNDSFRVVTFTVESGISLEKSLEERRRFLKAQGRNGFEIRVVTVGDRAIIDYFMDGAHGDMLGGEPSGHIILGKSGPEGPYLLDDPFVTYISLLSGLSCIRLTPDDFLLRLFRNAPDVYCARKPDARGDGDGISLAQKKALELWENPEQSWLSEYAKQFIPAYVSMFAEMYGNAFLNSAKAVITPTGEWKKLVETEIKRCTDFNPVIFELDYPGQADPEKLKVVLHIDHRAWAGPEVIRLSFHLVTGPDSMFKMGEGVFRNSGTSPKNAGYNKLWPRHPVRRKTIPDGELRELLDDLAIRRVQFTNTYIRTFL